MFKPLLAYQKSPTITYPVSASPKIDGIRGLCIDGVVKSRTLKNIPNTHIQEHYGHFLLDYIDGEFTIGPPTAKDVYRRSTSIIMSHDKPIDDIMFHIFDDFTELEWAYTLRYYALSSRFNYLKEKFKINLVPSVLIKNKEELDAYESVCLDEGYEGLMLRKPSGHYKCGRSGNKEGILLKLKRFVDSEARIIGIEAGSKNMNEAYTNEVGRTARSTKKENIIDDDIIGHFICEDIHGLFPGIQFKVARGVLTHDDARHGFINQQEWLGKIIKYKFFEGGNYEYPRFANYQGERSAIDIVTDER